MSGWLKDMYIENREQMLKAFSSLLACIQSNYFCKHCSNYVLYESLKGALCFVIVIINEQMDFYTHEKNKVVEDAPAG